MIEWLLAVWMSFLVMVVWMGVLWAAGMKIKNAALVDVGWGVGLVINAWIYAAMGDGYLPRKILILGMVSLWGIRLSLHLLKDRIIGQPEEGRYQELRKKWQTNVSFKFFFFYQFQGLLDVVLAIPFLLICFNPRPGIQPVEWIGYLLWCLAVLGESIADSQLKKFKADPANKGKVCRVGLWNYSRHPNYFFEWLNWCAYALIALAAPYGILGWISPLLILYFLLKVTGIPATEEQSIRSKGDGYREYQKTTSPFIPWFPKKVRTKT